MQDAHPAAFKIIETAEFIVQFAKVSAIQANRQGIDRKVTAAKIIGETSHADRGQRGGILYVSERAEMRSRNTRFTISDLRFPIPIPEYSIWRSKLCVSSHPAAIPRSGEPASLIASPSTTRSKSRPG